MNEVELMKSAKAFPSSEAVVYLRKDFETIYLGKDVVVLSPVGKPLDGPSVFPPVQAVAPAPVAPTVDLKAQIDEAVKTQIAELSKKFDEQLKAKDAEIVALKAPAAPKADATKVENKMVGTKKTLKEDAAKVFVAEMQRRG
jgi:hypothetical protein